MARINTRPSYQPTAASFRYTSEAPSGNHSDQENRDPDARPMSKGKQRARDGQESSSLPTPTSDSNDNRGHKRKRVEIAPDATQGNTQDGSEEDEDAAQVSRYYDPNQDPEERRKVKRKSRALERGFNEQKDQFAQGDASGLTETLHNANRIFKNVKQTSDATLDSRLLVNVSDLAYKKSAQLVLGDNSTGVDVDEFLSKCITYMRYGGPVAGDHQEAATCSRRRARANADSGDEEEEGVGEALDWELFGKHACFPFNNRPSVPTFLLGPLSVEKKQRAPTQRRAKQTRDTNAREARPETLSKDNLNQSDENSLTAICTSIRKLLSQKVDTAMKAVEQAGFRDQEELLTTQRGQNFLRKYHICDTGGVSLFEFVINPRSFGQTVENIFYVSFLIKEGSVGIQPDKNGLPTLSPAQAAPAEDQRKKDSSKHQAVLSMDYQVWRDLIEAYELEEPMIAHREEGPSTTQMGQRGWYT